MKICAFCGWSNSDIKDKCSKCGSVLPGGQSAQDNSVPNAKDHAQQPRDQVYIQARSQNCIQKIQELEKAVQGAMTWFAIAALVLSFLVTGGLNYVRAILDDVPLRYVEGPSGLQCLLGLGIIIAGFVVVKKIGENLTDNIRPYRDYCSVESLIVDNYKIFGTTINGNVQLSYNNIRSVRCRPAEFDGNRFRLDNDVLEIQDSGGKNHAFYTFSNSRELQTIIRMNLQNKG